MDPGQIVAQLEHAAKVRTDEARERYLRVVPEHAETAALAARLAGP
jgi:hypothetical protein